MRINYFIPTGVSLSVVSCQILSDRQDSTVALVLLYYNVARKHYIEMVVTTIIIFAILFGSGRITVPHKVNCSNKIKRAMQPNP